MQNLQGERVLPALEPGAEGAVFQQGGTGHQRGGDAGHRGHSGGEGFLRPGTVRETGGADFGGNPGGMARRNQTQEREGAGLPTLPDGTFRDPGKGYGNGQ